ncbi:ABC transporter ATP-binding protein [Bartonella krasnovii]|uniref:ABC transporter ATP-binding protein n=1 Tax=Bartonella krasnovii TaxID=2267275 RepID=A0A5B9D3D8_9HYPH|nr:ABC transporter ATP-binding protein [Bartonella krasnovii]QEE13036.1 ABC transporter ATP-binding protein [Bartonella krasnovii]UNF29154.1 ABC transporter ATP-binding protein/permease [Bartonella krasnovii]UNF35511.1 ABC transporter ATP-binding protein/permease [Bartonella krasnovii]UNF37126.1 ABC transporter ATP-binding protein/permease [Bartonella krasnovii]UNF38826.1 ABC transporter ATP-binding protein/permease [Bartonella krasnovii]
MAKKQLSSFDKHLIIRLLRENFHKHARWYSAAIISMIIISCTTATSAWIMRDVVNYIVAAQNFAMIVLISSFIAFIFILKGIATFAQTYFLSKAGNSIIAEQQRKIYARLMEQGVSFYHNNTSSDLLVRVTHNATAVRNIIDTIITTFVRDLLSVSGLLLVMFIQNFVLISITLIVGPLAFFGVRMALKRVRRLMEKELFSLGEIIKIVQETAVGIRVIKAFSLEEVMKKRMDKAICDVEKQTNNIATLEAITNPIMETLTGVAIAGIICFSGYLATQRAGVQGEFMSFIVALLLAYDPAKRLANVRVKIESGLVNIRTMFEILDRPLTVTEHKEAKDLNKTQGAIRFEHVSFAYTDNKIVLKDINLEIEAGKITALVGPSGSGKSTLINLIMRLYDPTKGRILINDQDIRYTTFRSLRKLMAYVGQDTFLFQGTVKYNIGLGKEGARDDEIIAAAKAANAHDFIMNLPNGYDTQIGDNGCNLSGGQKQRLAIARAMIHDSEILILDEATSALDSHTEAQINEAIHHLTKGRTTIIIAHRLSTIARAHKIVVIQNGQLIEQGTQKELLAKENGFYKKLHNIQFKKHTP